MSEEPAAGQEALLRDQLLRLRADFENQRRRELRERTEARSRAKAELIERLLGALDDLSRVAHPAVTAEASDPRVASILEGVQLVERKLLQELEREGLERLASEGEAFDPALHEAILTQPAPEVALEGRVAQVVQPGYRLGERLLRPARVVVWAAAP
ncbi:MAG: nucleotide exchange factor GrpE [Gemmatimonadetes bacterium]|nr:nucleotide exchange factor GrpE [Gemmatimonadota bacterium]